MRLPQRIKNSLRSLRIRQHRNTSKLLFHLLNRPFQFTVVDSGLYEAYLEDHGVGRCVVDEDGVVFHGNLGFGADGGEDVEGEFGFLHCEGGC